MKQLALIDLPPQPLEWDEREAYYSRPEYVWPLVEYLRSVMMQEHGRGGRHDQAMRWAASVIGHDTSVAEPCVGGGALVQGWRRYRDADEFSDRWYTGDIRPVACADWVGDWISGGEWERQWEYACETVDMVITNPPFTRAVEIVEASWRRCPWAVVAILQRATWYEPTEERGPWLRTHNPDQVTIGRCEFFRPDGTSAGKGDTCSYTWYVFGPDKQGLLGGHHEIIPWKEAPHV